MSAEVLRRAAALMRERAEAATPSPWENRRGPGEHVVAAVESVATVNSLRPREDRRHITSWHPAVALAVAKLLDDQAALIEEHGAAFFDIEAMGDADALTVARTYLGDTR